VLLLHATTAVSLNPASCTLHGTLVLCTVFTSLGVNKQYCALVLCTVFTSLGVNKQAVVPLRTVLLHPHSLAEHVASLVTRSSTPVYADGCALLSLHAPYPISHICSQVSAPINTTGKGYPWSMPNPISVTDGLVIKGNVLVNWHADPKRFMSLGLSPCTAGMPCKQTTVSVARAGFEASKAVSITADDNAPACCASVTP
jgi:hypothetical protein